MGFKINDKILSNLERVGDSAMKLDAQSTFKFEFLALDRIIPDPRNFYPVDDIENLAHDIYVNGLQHNIVVRTIDNSELFEIVSGERRYTAFKQLYAQYGDKYKIIPTKVITVTDLDAEILLIQSNATARVISPLIMIKQVERLTELYEIKKINGQPLGGKIRDLIGKDLGIGSTQTGKYQAIQKNLDTELMDKISDGELSIAAASELARLPKPQQFNAYLEKTNETETKKNQSKEEVDIEYSQPTGRHSPAAEKFRYSYVCPTCKAELYSNSNIKVRCDDCNEPFVLGEL